MPPKRALRTFAARVAFAAVLLLGCQPAVPQAGKAAKPHKTGNFRISGTVIDAVTLHPLARAQVSVDNTQDPKDSHSMATSDDGRFQFQVNAGKYSLHGDRRGYIASAYDQHENFWTGIVTGTGLDTESLLLRLPPTSILTGRVTDDNGEPVRNASISVFRETHFTGVARIQRFNNATTDDQGTYEIEPISAGTYFVAATAQPWYAVHTPLAQTAPGAVDRTLDVAFPTSFYRDATEAENATPIPIGRGARAEVDIHMNAVPALHLVFRPPNPDGHPNFDALVQKPVFDGTLLPQMPGLEQATSGVYEIMGLAPGRYAIQGRSRSNAEMKAPMEMYLSSDGQELDLATAPEPGSVKVTVNLPGAAKLPPEIYLALKNSRGSQVATPTNEDGAFEFRGVAPGQYELLAAAPGRTFSVASIASAGKITSEHSLNVEAGSSLNIAATLAGGLVTVKGFARQSGKPAPGAMIVLVPDNPESNLELFHRDQSDLDGSFALAGVVPGNYTILAIADGWDLDWAKPAVIAGYRQRGQKIVVPDQTKGSLKLTSPVEVQPRL